MHWIRIQNKQTIVTFARYPIISKTCLTIYVNNTSHGCTKNTTH